MKYIPYTIWLIATCIMFIMIFPAFAVYILDLSESWFDIGDKILES